MRRCDSLLCTDFFLPEKTTFPIKQCFPCATGQLFFHNCICTVINDAQPLPSAHTFPRCAVFFFAVIHKKSDNSGFCPLVVDSIPCMPRFVTKSRKLFPQCDQSLIIPSQLTVYICPLPIKPVQFNRCIVSVLQSIFCPGKFFPRKHK